MFFSDPGVTNVCILLGNEGAWETGDSAKLKIFNFEPYQKAECTGYKLPGIKGSSFKIVLFSYIYIYIANKSD